MKYARYNPIGFSDLPLLAITATIFTFCIAIFIARQTSKQVNSRVSLFMLFILFAINALDIANGTNALGQFTQIPFYSRTQRIAINPANSGILLFDPKAFLPIASKPQIESVASATYAGLNQWQKQGNDLNFALVLVESWGQIDREDQLTRAIAAPLLSREIAKRYTVTFGSVPFHGSTTNAELRELCGLLANYHDVVLIQNHKCLPDIFRSKGYEVIGMHGFFSDMFDRLSWWPSIGIYHSVFLDSFTRMGVNRRCGTAFPGVCDDDLISEMGNILRRRRQFAYALTLNSHLPLPPSQDFDGALRCSSLPIHLKNESCALAQHWRRVFLAVAHNAMRKDIAPTEFVLVGDHRPPLVGVSEQSFSSTQVPYILLTPKTTAR